MIAADVADFHQTTEDNVQGEDSSQASASAVACVHVQFLRVPRHDMIAADSDAPVRTPLSFLSASHEKSPRLRPGLRQREQDVTREMPSGERQRIKVLDRMRVHSN